MIKIQNGNIKLHGKTVFQLDNSVIRIGTTYAIAGASIWENLYPWFSYYSGYNSQIIGGVDYGTINIQANSLPLASTDVIVTVPLLVEENENYGVIVNLDSEWVQPNSITTLRGSKVWFDSQNNATVTCSITGTAVFRGNSRFGN